MRIRESACPVRKILISAKQLAVVQGLWKDYKPVLDGIDTSAAGLSKAAKMNLPLLKNMNKAVKIYEASVK